MMTNEDRVAAVMERVRVQLRKQRRMAGVLVLAAGFALGAASYHRKEAD